MDRDGNGRIELKEFVEAYFIQQLEVEERLKELETMIAEDTTKMQEIEAKHEEVKK
jgi:hypothetical protein